MLVPTECNGGRPMGLWVAGGGELLEYWMLASSEVRREDMEGNNIEDPMRSRMGGGGRIICGVSEGMVWGCCDGCGSG